MSSISKCQKRYQEQIDKQCEDRISNLPSNLIGHILSFLPTKYAVATSVLSTCWKQFWTLITSLDFDDKLKSTNNSVQLSFTNFVYRVLVIHRVSCLHMFRLKCCQNYDVSHVNTWVAASLVSGVQELDLSIRTKECTDQVLPRNLFACGTMVVLKLGTYFVMNVPSKVCMHRLKVLHLYGVEFRDDDSIYRLIRGCPVLDELSMENCIGEHVRVVHIFAPVLTKLFVKPLAYYYGSTHEIVLDTPALLYLGLDDDVESVEGYLVKNLSHLIKVDVNLGGPFSIESREITSKAVTDLIMGISSVQRLVLYGGFIGVLYRCNYRLPIFDNLTSLGLHVAFYVAWELVLRLLENSPGLETLVFSDGYESGDPYYWNPPQNVPTCLVSHLKIIEIWNFEGDKEELKMLEYFLKNAEVLEKLILHCESLEGEVEVLKQILRLQRGSKICKIEMC